MPYCLYSPIPYSHDPRSNLMNVLRTMSSIRHFLDEISEIFSVNADERVVERFIAPPSMEEGIRHAFNGAGEQMQSAMERGQNEKIDLEQPELF